jgi:general L-amino acid transport system permease protein
VGRVPGPRSTRFLIQAALVILTVWLLATAVSNAASNLARFNFAFDLGFLDRPAGFGIIQTLIPYSEASTYGRVFVVGLLNTILAAGLSVALATLLGFALGAARLSRNFLVRNLAAAYVGLFRNLPLLLVLFFFYFGVLRQLPPPRAGYSLSDIYLNNRGLFLPVPESGVVLAAALLAMVLGVVALASRRTLRRVAGAGAVMAFLACAAGLIALPWSIPEARGLSISGGAVLIPELVALVAALTFYAAAYIAEIVRAGIESVPRGQVEAAESLGLTEIQTLRLVILPQALRLIVPPLTNQYLTLTKNSSLAVAIGYPDLVAVFAGTALAQTGNAVVIIAMIMGVYLLLSLGTAALLDRWNRRRWG